MLHQISFTRAGGQSASDGWQVVNPSPDLPKDAVAAYSRMQNNNADPQPVFDEEDGDLIMYELQTDAAHTFLTRVKYGLTDENGRKSMFAHSFVMPAGDFALDPQSSLRIGKSNFSFDIESTKNIPAELALAEPLTLAGAMDAASLDADTYITLVKCIHFTLDSKTKTALHVICDCEESTIRALLICAYCALPHEMRRRLSFSTYETKGHKLLYFEREIKDLSSNYIVPESGETNISEMSLKRLERYDPFIKHVPRHIDDDPSEFFAAIDAKLALFGAEGSPTLELCGVAYDLWCEDASPDACAVMLTPEEISSRLNRYLDLSAAVKLHGCLDQQIQYLLSDVVERGIRLNSTIAEKLCRRLEQTDHPDLISAGYRYNSARIVQLEPDEGARFLYDSFTDRTSEAFLSVKSLLCEDANGRNILERYYLSYLPRPYPITPASIRIWRGEIEPIIDLPLIQSRLGELCAKYLDGTISPSRPCELMDETEQLLREILPPQCAEFGKTIELVKTAFWDKFDLTRLRLNDMASYETVYISHRNADLAAELCIAYRDFANYEFEGFVDKIEGLLSKRYNRFDPEVRSGLVRLFQSECLRKLGSCPLDELDTWLTLAMLGKDFKNPIAFLLENAVPAFLLHFESAYARSRLLRDEERLIKFTEQLQDYVQAKGERYRDANYVLGVIKDAQKRDRQEAKRREKMGDEAEGEKKGFSIKNLFRKNDE